MGSRKLVGAIVVTLLLVGAGVWGYWQFTQKAPEVKAAHTVETKPEAAAKPSMSPPPELLEMKEPKRFIVPKLGIDQPIRKVGLLPNGEMAMPDDLQTVGWYGGIPGNPGKPVLAGHTGYPNSPSVFRKLDALVVGDSVKVLDEVHVAAEFEIIRIEKYTLQDAPRDQIFGDSPTARLSIVTCAGDWDPKTQSYSHRLVIMAARK